MLDRILQALEPEALVDWMSTTGLNVLLIILISIIAYLVLSFVTRRITRHMQQLDDEEDSHFDLRIETIRRLINTTALVIIIIVATLTVLGEVGVEIGPVLASVGVASLALGLGAQTLVKDALGGFFIIVEGQYQVGDVIEFDGYVGTVEDLTLRSTQVRDVQGYLHFIPNGEIRIVTNRTRDWSRAVMDIGVSYEDDVVLAVQTLEEIGALAVEDSQIGPLLLEAPSVIGVEGLDEWQVRLRVMVKTVPNEHWAVQRYYRQQVRQLFPAKGLSLPSPRQEVVLVQGE